VNTAVLREVNVASLAEQAYTLLEKLVPCNWNRVHWFQKATSSS
jgi:hypothetical protein